MQQTAFRSFPPHSGTDTSSRHCSSPKSCTFTQKRQAKKALPLAPDYTLPAIGRVADLFRLENLRAGQTKRKDCPSKWRQPLFNIKPMIKKSYSAFGSSEAADGFSPSFSFRAASSSISPSVVFSITGLATDSTCFDAFLSPPLEPFCSSSKVRL